MSETDEAAERARSFGAERTGRYFNDSDRTRTALSQWQRVSPGIVASLDPGADGLTHDLAFYLIQVKDGVRELTRLIEGGAPREVRSWLPELRARFQIVDDLCLVAARGD